MEPTPTQRRAVKPTSAPPIGVERAITFITVPCPPSANKLYKNIPGRGRAKTAEYRAWSDEAGWNLRSQHPAPVPGRVIIVIGIERDNAQSDIDNRCKAILDLLVTHKIIKNDTLVTALAMAWAAKGTSLARIAVLPAHDLSLDLILESDGASGGWFLKAPMQEGPANDGN